MAIPLRPRVRDDLVFRQVEEDFIIYDPVHDRTALLNTSAAVVVDLCDGTLSAGEIAARLAELFSVSNETAERGVRKALDTLYTQKFLVEDDEPS